MAPRGGGRWSVMKTLLLLFCPSSTHLHFLTFVGLSDACLCPNFSLTTLRLRSLTPLHQIITPLSFAILRIWLIWNQSWTCLALVFSFWVSTSLLSTLRQIDKLDSEHLEEGIFCIFFLLFPHPSLSACLGFQNPTGSNSVSQHLDLAQHDVVCAQALRLRAFLPSLIPAYACNPISTCTSHPDPPSRVHHAFYRSLHVNWTLVIVGFRTADRQAPAAAIFTDNSLASLCGWHICHLIFGLFVVLMAISEYSIALHFFARSPPWRAEDFALDHLTGHSIIH